MFPGHAFVKMYLFVIDMGEENRYSLAAPQGVMSHEAL